MFAFIVASLIQLTPFEAAHVVRSQFESSAREVPQVDELLSKAALILAMQCDELGVNAVSALPQVTQAVSSAGAWDTNLAVFVFRASTNEIESAIQKQTFARSARSHVGIGVFEKDKQVNVVVLLANRVLELRTFPRQVQAREATFELLATSGRSPDSIRVFISRPDGSIASSALKRKNRNWSTLLSFAAPGKHVIELVLDEKNGPQLGALFFVQSGTQTSIESGVSFTEASSEAEAKAIILTRTNSLRLASGLKALVSDKTLDVVAQDYALQMETEGFFAHLDREGKDVAHRLTKQGVAFVSAGENLGRSSGALAAHFGIEHSPGHRANLINSNFNQMGLGIVRCADGQTLVVEVFAQVSNSKRDPLEQARMSFDLMKTKLDLPTLKPNDELNQMAQIYAVQKASKNSNVPIEEQVFSKVSWVKSLAVDVVRGSQPMVSNSKNMGNAAYQWFGIGVAKAARDQWVVVVIYANGDASTQ